MAALRKLTTTQKRLALAILAGLLAACLMFLYAGNLEAEAQLAQSTAMREYGGPRTEVLVATRNVLAGEELNADNATMKPWLSDLLPQGAVTSPEEAYGMTLTTPLWANEPVLLAKLGTADRLIQVPDGLSAVSIPISDDMAVGGSILPGSSVDVYAIGATQVRLVIADVLVLEASNGIGTGEVAAREQAGVVLGNSSRAALKWVTLAVSDETIAELLSAARDNTISLVLPGQNAGALMALELEAQSQQARQESINEETSSTNTEAGEDN